MLFSQNDIKSFIDVGYLSLHDAFSEALAKECRDLLWEMTGLSPNKPETWTQPVIRIGELDHPCFVKAANSPRLRAACDQLVGKGNYIPKESLGSFPIRFPSTQNATDTGWHVDASFPGENTSDYMTWKINIYSRNRALLMLFLFSEVGPEDAPTILKPGSHQHVARILHPYGENGLSFMQLAGELGKLPEGVEEKAIGHPGTVYLCHPFLVHRAQEHRGRHPRFMAQPALLSTKPLDLHNMDSSYPTATAIQKAIRTNPNRP
jgi:hypothetical protein